MPRFRSYRRSSFRRPRVRTAWEAVQTSFNDLAVNSTETVTICDPTAQHSVGLSPRLEAIRGGFIVDPDFSPQTEGPQTWHYGAMIYLAETALTAWNSTNLAREDILWAYMGAGSGNMDEVLDTAVGRLRWGHATEHPTHEFHVKSKRRLSEKDRVFFTISNLNTGFGIDTKYSMWARCLIRPS